MARINMAFAQQIVDSAKTIVGWNVNFIDPQGVILASTDPKRVGTYHEAGHLAAKNRQVQVVHGDDEYKGAHGGINYPIIMNGSVVGVVGITGQPEVVEKYGFLLTKICEVFMKEYWLELESFNEQQRTSKLVMALIYHDREGVQQILGDDNLISDEKYVSVSYSFDCAGDGTEQHRIEMHLTQEFQALGLRFYTFIYPNKLVCLVPESLYRRWKQRVPVWEKSFAGRLYMGVGTWENMYRIHLSYRFSKMALKYATLHDNFCLYAEQMNLELLIQSLDEQVRRQFREHVCGSLDEEELQMLHSYFRHELSLQDTAKEMVIHKNTLQYRLKRVHDKTGLDPRKFSDAVVLYIASHMED